MVMPCARVSASNSRRAPCPPARNGPDGTRGNRAQSHAAPVHDVEREHANVMAMTSALAAGAKQSCVIRAFAAASGTTGPSGRGVVSPVVVVSRHAIVHALALVLARAIALARERSDGEPTLNPHPRNSYL